MSNEKQKGNRVWLNPLSSDDDGAMQWKVSGHGDRWISAEISIWDCGRKISLDFDFSTNPNPSYEASAEQRAKKIDLLISELQKFRTELGEAYKLSINSDNTPEVISSREILLGDEDE